MAPPGRPRRAEGTIRALIGARLLIGLVVTALLLIGGGAVKRTSAATTATTTLVATDDRSVSSSRPMKTFGTADRLQVDASPVLRNTWWVINNSMLMTGTTNNVLLTRAQSEVQWIEKVASLSDNHFAVVEWSPIELKGKAMETLLQ